MAPERSRNMEDWKREETAAKSALLLEDIKKRVEKLEEKTVKAKQGKWKGSIEGAKVQIKANSTIRKSTKRMSSDEWKAEILPPTVYDPSKPSS
jgi:hypothetical protein